jgi:RNA polymerase sigma-70 factor (ECF subfamily)
MPPRPWTGTDWSEGLLAENDARARFEEAMLPHLGAAYNLARWLTRNDHDAEDVVQEAYVRALKFFGGFHGGDGRAWLLAVVRNTCYTWLKQNRPREKTAPFDEAAHGIATDEMNPERLAVRGDEARQLRLALEEMPAEFREAVVLRDLEGLSYQEIAAVADVPLGTVMSRLSRGRKRLQQTMTGRTNKEPGREL